MRVLFKKIIGYFKLGNFTRGARNILYGIFDYIGNALLFLIPKEEFNVNKINKILIIRLDRIGDVILSTPAIKAIRNTFSKAIIHILVSGYTKDLLIGNPNIDKLLIYKNDKIDRDYDSAIALHPGFTPNFQTFKSGAKFRVGYTGQGGSFFLTHKIKDDRGTRIRHEVESALEVAAAVGGKTEDKQLEISITEEGEYFAERFFKRSFLGADKPIVVIHPGARQDYIKWKEEGFAEVGDRLIREKNAQVILTGDEKERFLMGKITSLMQEKPLVAIGLRLTQLISLIRRCSLFIGNATGPMHIAAGLDIPVVAIFGCIHPLDSYQEWGPWSKNSIVVTKNLNCLNCHPSDCKTFDCMSLISVQDVFEAAQKQLIKNYEKTN